MKLILCLVSSAFFFSWGSWAQTDAGSSDVTDSEKVEKKIPDKGPHDGHLVQAGTYYLEIVWDAKDQSVKAYLLDIEARNETVQNSELGIFFLAGNVESEMSCQAVENHYECKQNGKKFKKGQLSISSKRNGTQAEEVKVKVPFEDEKPTEKLEKKKKTK
jgi:hypothetical protein